MLFKEKIKQQITSIYFASEQRYGSPRITFELNVLDYKLSRVTVEKYMQEFRTLSFRNPRNFGNLISLIFKSKKGF
ncbi:IS3 family transposase [Chryseobacterium indoltheticum]|uniref:IS3 family transposase n=1 Tax=Chryseobacterium indoltheticum TaxID=254 RepID=UPI0015F25666